MVKILENPSAIQKALRFVKNSKGVFLLLFLTVGTLVTFWQLYFPQDIRQRAANNASPNAQGPKPKATKTPTPTPTAVFTPTPTPFVPTVPPFATPTSSPAVTPTNTPTPFLPSPTPTPSPSNTPTPTPTTIPFRPGDINQDGKVDVVDFSYLLSKWGTSDALADLNHDGKVDVLDLSIMLSNWGP